MGWWKDKSLGFVYSGIDDLEYINGESCCFISIGLGLGNGIVIFVNLNDSFGLDGGWWFVVVGIDIMKEIFCKEIVVSFDD